jgi:hypothetical protein
MPPPYTLLLLWPKALLLWFGILVLAFANGTLRAQVLIPAFGSTAGLISSGLVLCACIFGVALVAAHWYGQLTSNQWLLIGAFWLVLTLLFEFSVGRFIEHKSWSELLEAYTFKGGNIWPLVLVAAFIAPWCAAKVRGLS